MNKNVIKTFVFLAALGGLLVLAGGALGGRGGLAIGLGIALLLNVGSYFFRASVCMHSSAPARSAAASRALSVSHRPTSSASKSAGVETVIAVG